MVILLLSKDLEESLKGGSYRSNQNDIQTKINQIVWEFFFFGGGGEAVDR